MSLSLLCPECGTPAKARVECCFCPKCGFTRVRKWGETLLDIQSAFSRGEGEIVEKSRQKVYAAPHTKDEEFAKEIFLRLLIDNNTHKKGKSISDMAEESFECAAIFNKVAKEYN